MKAWRRGREGGGGAEWIIVSRILRNWRPLIYGASRAAALPTAACRLRERNLDQRGGGCQRACRETHKDYTASLQLADTQPPALSSGTERERERDRERERGGQRVKEMRERERDRTS